MRDKSVKFMHIKQSYFSTLYASMKTFNLEVTTNYPHEDRLKELLMKIRKVINKFFTTADNYGILIDKEMQSLIDDFHSIRVFYNELFDLYCKPIINSIIDIKNNLSESNLYLQNLISLIDSNRKQCIVVRFENVLENFSNVPIIKSSKFLKSGNFYDDVFFLGSPDFFDKRFSKLFLADNTYFICYEFFQNEITTLNDFKKINKNNQIHTIYNNVVFEGMKKGEVISLEFGTLEEKIEKEEIILRHEKSAELKKIYDQVEANLVLLTNKHYTFIPVNTKVRTISKEHIAIENISVTNLVIGDWILFRNHSNTDLVIEVANNILGERYEEARSYQYKWKKRLKFVINKYGLEKVIYILKKNGITQASLTNIRNWLEPASIQPNNFSQLLSTLKFSKDEIVEILEATSRIKNAHLKAGKVITAELIKELSEDKFEDVIENGYATFTSPLIPGASFNIETVTDIDHKAVTVSKSDILAIWRG